MPSDTAGTSLTAVPHVLELNQRIDFDRGRTNARRGPSLRTQYGQRRLRQRRMRRGHGAKVVQAAVDAHASGNGHVARNRSIKLAQGRGDVDAILLPAVRGFRSTREGARIVLAVALQVSAYSLKSLAVACRPLMSSGSSIVGLDFDNSRNAWPVYDWMGVAKAAFESTARYLARDLGPEGIRVNLVAAGPVRTISPSCSA